MTAPQKPGRQHTGEEHALATLLQEGQGYERCYDTFAPALYRYCWTLLGPHAAQEEDAPGAAVRATFLAAVELLPRLRDRDLFRPWMFALARTVCQQRGFATDTPYTLLSVHPDDQPFVEALSTLPPSQRELLELTLRHGLSHTQTAVVLGLDPETVSDLCRSAAQRVADLLTEQNREDGRSGSRWIIADVPAALTSVALPGPPRHLREQVVAACTAAGAAPRREAAGLVLPPGVNGFPLQRARGSEPAAEAPADPTEHAASCPALSAPDATEALSEPAPETGDDGDASAEPHRLSGWLLPATAGLFTALVAFSLWGIGAFLGRSDDLTGAAPPPVDGVTISPMSDHEPEGTDPASVSVPSAEVSEPTPAPSPSAAEEEAGAAEPEEADDGTGTVGEAAPTGEAGTSEPPAQSPQTPQAPDPEAQAPPSGSQQAPATAPPAQPQEQQGDQGGSQGQTQSPRRPVSTLLEGVLDLLGLNRHR